MEYLFCNTGWMEFYEGNNGTDQISGGGSFVAQEGTGHEVCNFLSCGGYVYGYVQPTGGQRSESIGTINLEKIGQSTKSNDDFIEGVLVIWTATRPEGGTVVVGWYKDAIVFRKYQCFDPVPASHSENGLSGYRIRATSENAHLLTVDERILQIPRRVKGGIGQSNVWYGKTDIGLQVVNDVQRLVSDLRGTCSSKRSRKTNPDHNKDVETAAINVIWQYYEDLGYELVSVEKDNVGWDLEASLDNLKLQIEVKGLSGESPSIELSPNEYKAFSNNQSNYRLAIVTCALSSAPQKYICRYSSEVNGWCVSGDQAITLKVEERVTAKVILNA